MGQSGCDWLAPAALIDIDLATRVLGLPNGYEALALAVDTVSDRQTRQIVFTRADLAEDPRVILSPSGQNLSDNLATTLRHSTADLLDTTRQAIDAARNPGCSGLLGCLIGGLTQAIRNTLQSLAGTLVTTVANVLNVTGAAGTVTDAILSGIVGLDLARAELEVLEAGCQTGMARLVQ